MRARGGGGGALRVSDLAVPSLEPDSLLAPTYRVEGGGGGGGGAGRGGVARLIPEPEEDLRPAVPRMSSMRLRCLYERIAVQSAVYSPLTPPPLQVPLPMLLPSWATWRSRMRIWCHPRPSAPSAWTPWRHR